MGIPLIGFLNLSEKLSEKMCGDNPKMGVSFFRLVGMTDRQIEKSIKISNTGWSSRTGEVVRPKNSKRKMMAI